MIRSQISQLIQDVVDGNESACRAYSILKDLEFVVKNGLEVIKEPVMQEAREFNKGETYYGGKWEFRSTGVTLDFTKDETYVDLDSKAKARRKDLTEAFKAHESGKGFFDSDSGEQIPILPVKIQSKETIVFKPVYS